MIPMKVAFNSYNAKLIRVLACLGVIFTHLGGGGVSK